MLRRRVDRGPVLAVLLEWARSVDISDGEEQQDVLVAKFARESNFVLTGLIADLPDTGGLELGDKGGSLVGESPVKRLELSCS